MGRLAKKSNSNSSFEFEAHFARIRPSVDRATGTQQSRLNSRPPLSPSGRSRGLMVTRSGAHRHSLRRHSAGIMTDARCVRMSDASSTACRCPSRRNTWGTPAARLGTRRSLRARFAMRRAAARARRAHARAIALPSMRITMRRFLTKCASDAILLTPTYKYL